MYNWLGKYPGKTLHRLGTALGGLWISTIVINYLWPLPDQIKIIEKNSASLIGRESFYFDAAKILVLIVDSPQIQTEESDRLQGPKKGLKELILLELSSSSEFNAVKLPLQKKITLPGSKGKFLPIVQTYNIGGVALSANITSSFLGLEKEDIDHFIILNYEDISKFIDFLGGIKITLSKPVSIKKPDGNEEFYFAFGKQTINGEQAKLLFLDIEDRENSPSIRASILEGIFRGISSSKNLKKIEALGKGIITNLETSLDIEGIKILAKVIEMRRGKVFFQKTSLSL